MLADLPYKFTKKGEAILMTKSRRAYARDDSGLLSTISIIEDDEGQWYSLGGEPINPDGADVQLRGWPDSTVASCDNGQIYVGDYE